MWFLDSTLQLIFKKLPRIKFGVAPKKNICKEEY